MTKRGWGLATATGLLLSTFTVSSAATAVADPPAVASGEVALVRVPLPNAAMFDELVAGGADIAARPRVDDGRALVDLVLTGSQLDALTARGARTVHVIQRSGDGQARLAESQRSARRAVAADTLHVLSANWWTANGQTFLQT